MDFSLVNELIISVLLGLTQGITEFIPISSTAHMRLIVGLIARNRDIGLVTSNVIQLGTLVAVVQYFWGDLVIYSRRIRQCFTNPQEMKVFTGRFVTWIQGNSPSSEVLSAQQKSTLPVDITIAQLIMGTLPIIVLGLFFKDYADSDRSYDLIAAFLIAGSVLMGFAEYQHSKMKRTDLTPMLSFGETLLVGLFQSLAIFPGISRSGATLSGALLLGRGRAESVRFSFLLSVPAILLSGLYDLFGFLRSLIQGGTPLIPQAGFWTTTAINMSFASLVIAVVLAYFSGFAVLKWLLKYLSVHPTRTFIYYRVGLAVLLIAVSIFF